MSSPAASFDIDDGVDDRCDGLDGLDVAETLAAAERAVADVHAVEVRALAVDLHFADLHATDPHATDPHATDSGHRRRGVAGAARLVRLGGDGTPLVLDLPICELAIAQHTTLDAARRQLADALDLRHRLPRTWARLQAGHGRVWVARKVATQSRHLDRDQIRAVDAALSTALAQSPGRQLATARAAILRADPDAARRMDDQRRRHRFVSIGPTDFDGLRKVLARIDAGDAHLLEVMLFRVADALETRPDLIPDLIHRPAEVDDHGGVVVPAGYTPAELLAEALTWLAHPEDLIALLAGTLPLRDPDPDPEPVSDPVSDPVSNPGPETTDSAARPARRAPAPPVSPASPARQRARAYVHLSLWELIGLLPGGPGRTGLVGRVEDVGPLAAQALSRFLGHSHVEVTPVIDLHDERSVNGYQHPADICERGFLRMNGDVFPHATSQSRHTDSDHPTPFDPTGPPGQTGDRNHAPLTRTAHRAKTHLGYQLWQVGLTTYVWRTPHGLHRLVDPTGTHVIDHDTAHALIAAAGPDHTET